PFLFFGIAWAFRGIVFCFFLRNSSTVVNQIVSWRLWSPALALSPASLSCPFPLDQASCFCTGTGHLRPSFLYFAGKQKRRPHPREAPFLFHFKNSPNLILTRHRIPTVFPRGHGDNDVFAFLVIGFGHFEYQFVLVQTELCGFTDGQQRRMFVVFR